MRGKAYLYMKVWPYAAFYPKAVGNAPSSPHFHHCRQTELLNVSSAPTLLFTARPTVHPAARITASSLAGVVRLQCERLCWDWLVLCRVRQRRVTSPC